MNELLGWYGYETGARDQPKLALSCRSQAGSNSSEPDSPKYTDGCEWCGKQVDERKGLSSGDATFCSELCFSQSRRANFKKNKTCDWCKHIRHTVSYVDFQDGASQLQFCSDKCLNQYKMHIFCRETRAHLELHPHLSEEPTSSSNTLITPDLWLKHCRSSPEPRTPSPTAPEPSENLPRPQPSPLPLISVAHPSKIMAVGAEARQRASKLAKKHQRKRGMVKHPVAARSPAEDLPQDLRVRHTPPGSSGSREEGVAKGCGAGRKEFGFAEHRNNFKGLQSPFYKPSSHPPTHKLPPLLPISHIRPQPPPSPQTNPLPPVTVLVPYPIFIPLPLPIPIPIPISSHLLAEEKQRLSDPTNNNNNNNNQETKEDRAATTDLIDGATTRQMQSQDKTRQGLQEKEKDKDAEVSEAGEVQSLSVRPLRKRKRICGYKNK